MGTEKAKFRSLAALNCTSLDKSDVQHAAKEASRWRSRHEGHGKD